MYFPYFVTYIGIGLIIGVSVFFWALKRGQFRDQERARFLPLEDEPETAPVKVSKFNRCEAYAMLFLAVAGLSATVAVLIFAIFTAP